MASVKLSLTGSASGTAPSGSAEAFQQDPHLRKKHATKATCAAATMCQWSGLKGVLSRPVNHHK